MKMKKSLSAAVLALALIAVAAQPASASVVKRGSVSCEIFQKGGVKSTTTDSAFGYAPGGNMFNYDWGTSTKRTYRVNGTSVGGGNWEVNSFGILYNNETSGYCY